MSSLFNIGAKGATPPTVLAGLRVQTSVYGVPIPIIYGRARVAGNLIHLMDFAARQVTVASQSSKILGINIGGKVTQKGYAYFAAMALGLCEGPIDGIEAVWQDKFDDVPFSAFAAAYGWVLFTGTSSQAAWSYTTSNHPSEAVPYQFTAYVANPNAELPNATMPQLSWEVKGFLAYGGGVVDASPAAIVPDFLTNAQYGVGFPSAKIGTLTDFVNYCGAAGLFCSPVYNEQKPARDHLNELMEIANTAPVWSDGLLKFKPYGDVALTANGKTYTPNVTPVYDLTNNDYLPRGENVSPVTVHRRDPAEVANVVTVEIEDRAFDYNAAPYKAEDLPSQIADGQRPLPTLQLHAIKTQDIGRTVAQLRLQREQNVRNDYEFLLGVKYSLLEPMDLVTLTETGLQFVQLPVRITSVVELADERGFTVTAEDWPLGTANASLYGSQGANGFAPDTNATPANTDARIIEVPLELQTSPFDLFVAATGGTNWGGCDVYASTDNTTYTWVGRITGKAAIGATTATLATNAAWPSQDTTHTLSVSIAGSVGRTLDSYSTDDYDALVSLCLVGDEWLAYKNASLTGASAYDLTTMYRGLYGSTIPASHASNSLFTLIDSSVLVLPLPFLTLGAGDIVYFKLPAFNVFGNQTEDLADISPVSITLSRDPSMNGNAVPQATTSVNPDGSWTISVDGPSWARSYKYSVSTSSFPSDATVLASGTTSSGRQITVSGSAGALTLGQTIYATFIPYVGTAATGFHGESIHARGTFQDYSATKTVYFSGARLTDIDPSAAYVQIVNGYAQGIQDNFTGCDLLQIPDGVTLTQIDADLYSAAGGGGFLHTRTTFEFFRTDNTGAVTSLGSVYSEDHAGWETKTLVLSETTTGRRYKLLLSGSYYGYPGSGGATRYAGFALTYTVPSTVNTL